MTRDQVITLSDSDSDVEYLPFGPSSSSQSKQVGGGSSSSNDTNTDSTKLRNLDRGMSVLSMAEVHPAKLDKERKRARDPESSLDDSNVGPLHQDDEMIAESSFDRAGFKRGKASHGNVTWLSSDQSLLPNEPVTKMLDGRSEDCWKIYRGGMKIGDEVYRLNDAVVFGEDSLLGLIRAIYSIKPLNKSFRTRHYVHVQFLRGQDCDTELFLEHCQCQDVRLQSIESKLDFELVSSTSSRNNSKYFCRYVFETTHCCYRQPLRPEEYGSCDSCYHKDQKGLSNYPALVGQELICGTQTYHRSDFIYLDCKVQGEPYLIGQIEKLAFDDQISRDATIKVKVRMLKRRKQVLPKAAEYLSSRNLVVTDDYQDFDAAAILGKCIVVHNNAESTEFDPVKSYWCDQRIVVRGDQQMIQALQRPLKGCISCLELEKRSWADREACRRTCRFPASDYYSGAGGFILPGLDFFDWQSAVDNDAVSCQTLSQLSRSKPSFRVNFGTVQEWVQRSLESVPDSHRPSLPAPGTVFLMTGGVPCQGHTAANHNRDGSDSRNGELFVFLGELARLQPSYVVLENVPAFKWDVEGTTDEEANGNFARRAMKELVLMNYQCRLGILDSRSFGSPQNRQRLFIVAAKRGSPLPDLPSPSHANPRVSATVFSNLESGAEFPFFPGQRGTPGTGPHPAVTVRDAIGDLPDFRFSPPPGIGLIPSTRRVPVFDPRVDRHRGNHTRIGFEHPVAYKSPPMTEFQSSKRGDVAEVGDHWCSYAAEREHEIIFVDSRLSNPPGPKRRAEWEKGFSTLLTSARPGGKATNPIHPDGERTFSVAERKRAMGFPDWWRFSGSPIDQNRQTGNAVCFETVEAIYKTIFDSCVVPWWLAAGRPTEDVMAAFKRDHP
ncbi:hypothetical protein IAR55_002454 [Kwoniella newhampshirensis]|uniref:DNA (cytosine-5-)-methyltransferase n=1 Tax=Kwoniella newhampshirensis TaxID=1651941 RepID=A0AAW0YZ80_9TREE